MRERSGTAPAAARPESRLAGSAAAIELDAGSSGVAAPRSTAVSPVAVGAVEEVAGAGGTVPPLEPGERATDGGAAAPLGAAAAVTPDWIESAAVRACVRHPAGIGAYPAGSCPDEVPGSWPVVAAKRMKAA